MLPIKTKHLRIFLAFACILFIGYQIDNVPRIDDEYLGEQVFWLLKVGKVRSGLGFADLGYDVYQSIFHKLFVYCGYLACRIGGWSLISLHMVTYLSFLAFLPLFYVYTRRQYGNIYPAFFLICLTLLLFNQDLLYAAGDFRPEVLIMTLGFASYVLLMRYLNQGKSAALAGSAIAAGLCMFAHLNGAVFIAAGCLLLLQRKKYGVVFAYAVLAALAFAPYFADTLYHADLKYFWHQFRHDPILNPDQRWYASLLQLANEQMRFLFTEKQVLLTATLLFVLFTCRQRLRARQPGLLSYTLFLVLGLALICPSKSTKYMVLYLPFLYLIITEGWLWLEEQGSRSKVLAIRTLLLANILVSLVYSAQQINRNVHNLSTGGIIAEHSAIANMVRTQHSRVSLLAPRLMIFNELPCFKQLMDIERVLPANMSSFLRGSKLDYVIFEKKDKARYDWTLLEQAPDHLLVPVDSTAHYIITRVNR